MHFVEVGLSQQSLQRRPKPKPALPVDRGWAWLIMLGAFVNIMLAVAFGRSLSLLLPYILARYQAPATVTTLAFGISDLTWSLTNILIPTLLLPRFSVRSLALTGAFFHCMSVIALAYSPNIIVFNCIFGVTGCAGGLMLLPTVTHVGHFFNKRLSFASSVIQAGSSMASVTMPLFVNFLLDTYNYQGTLLILGGLSFNCLAACMLFRPLSMYEERGSQKDYELQNFSKTTEAKDLDFEKCLKQKSLNSTSLPEEDGDDEKSKLLLIGNIYPIDRQLDKTLSDNLRNRSPNDLFKKEIKLDSNRKEEENFSNSTTEKCPIQSSQDSNFRDGIHNDELQNLQNGLSRIKNNNDNENIKNNNDNENINIKIHNAHIQTHEFSRLGTLRTECTNQIKSIDNLQEKPMVTSDSEPLPTKSSKPVQGYSSDTQADTSMSEESATSDDRFRILGTLRDRFKSSVLSNPVALMLVLAGGLSTPGGNMYLPVLGLENGLSHHEVPWMLTIIGVADILGKLAIGYFADLNYVRPVRIVCVTQLIVGVMFQFTAFYPGFGPMIAMATVYGLTAGVIQALLTPMIVQMVGLPYLAQVTSILYLATGVFTFILNVSVGAIRDSSGSFVGGFNFLGGMLLISFVLLMLEPVFRRCRDQCWVPAK